MALTKNHATLLAMSTEELGDWCIDATMHGSCVIGCSVSEGKALVAALRGVGATAKYDEEMKSVLVLDYTTPEQELADDYRENKQPRDEAFRAAGL